MHRPDRFPIERQKISDHFKKRQILKSMIIFPISVFYNKFKEVKTRKMQGILYKDDEPAGFSSFNEFLLSKCFKVFPGRTREDIKWFIKE